MPTPSDEAAWRAISDLFRDLERRRLGRTLLAAAHASAHARGDDFEQHFRNAGALIALATTRCVVTQDEANLLRHEWCETESEWMLRTLPPALRRRLLLDPSPGSASFIPLRRRLQMLREIDEAA
jgi:hypothetical protein